MDSSNDKGVKPPKGYVVSRGVVEGEDYAAETEPWMGNADRYITGAEIGETTNMPENPFGPSGFPPNAIGGGSDAMASHGETGPGHTSSSGMAMKTKIPGK